MTATLTDFDLSTLDMEDAGCEVKFNDNDAPCGKPATHLVLSHNSECVNIQSRFCTDCVALIHRLGLVGDNVMCRPCGQRPVIMDIRPI